MTTVSIELEGAPQATAFFEKRARFAGNMMVEIGRPALEVVKEDIGGEIRGQRYLAGGTSWDKTVQLGRLAGGRPALQSYARRWASATPRISAAEASIRISAPAAGVHAGGTGTTRSQRTTTIRLSGDRVRPVQSAVFRRTGGYISRRTLTGKGIQVPARPHANPDNLTTARKVEAVMKRQFEGA